MWDDKFRPKDANGDEFHMYDQGRKVWSNVPVIVTVVVVLIMLAGLAFICK